jgi:hypothetical protein
MQMGFKYWCFPFSTGLLDLTLIDAVFFGNLTDALSFTKKVSSTKKTFFFLKDFWIINKRIFLPHKGYGITVGL